MFYIIRQSFHRILTSIVEKDDYHQIQDSLSKTQITIIKESIQEKQFNLYERTFLQKYISTIRSIFFFNIVGLSKKSGSIEN